jgi:Protein of unknown function (DUF3150)
LSSNPKELLMKNLDNHIIKKGVFFLVDIGCPTGSRTIDPKELNIDISQYPKTVVKELGKIVLYDTSILSPIINKVRQPVYRHLRRYGTQVFPHIFAVGNDNVQQTQQFMLEKSQFYQDTVSDIEGKYDKSCDSWIETIRSDSDSATKKYLVKILQEKRKTFAEVALGFRFKWHTASIDCADMTNEISPISLLLNSTDKIVLAEVSSDLEKLYLKSFHDKDSARHTTIETIRVQQSKLQSLAFVSPLVARAAQHIENTLVSLNHDKFLRHANFEAVRNLLLQFQDPENLIAILQRVQDISDSLPDTSQTLTMSSSQFSLFQGAAKNSKWPTAAEIN